MKFLAMAVVGLAAALPSSAFAAQSWDAWYVQSAQTAERAIAITPAVDAVGRPGFVPLNVRVQPDTNPSFYANFVAAGLNAAGVPCYNCVNGTNGTFGLPAPFNYVVKSSYWQYNVSWTNLTFKGTCYASFAATSGSTVISKATTKVPGVSGAGSYDWGWVANPATFSGKALLTGKVRCGKKTSTTTANLIFQ